MGDVDVRVIKEIHNGPLSKVYQVRIGDHIYVKKIIDNKKLFLREVKILQKVSHVNIPQLIDFYEEKGDKEKYVIIQEFVDGIDVRSYVCYSKSSKPKREDLLSIMIQILEGFLNLHQHNIYHRDIKPANIMITRDHNVKIIDYGLSCIAGSSEEDEVYCDKKLKGTPHYIAPELFKNDKDVTEEMWRTAEVYSVGCILYFLLHGHAPYEGYAIDIKDLREMIESDEETPYDESRYRDISNIKDVDIIVKGLLHKNPQKRLSLEEALVSLKNV